MPTPPRYQAVPAVRIIHPEWSKNATIYQINTRQFTAEGTFRAAEAQLQRLKALGAVILWLMPVQVIGEKNRKGTLGSPYAVKDYYRVEPELGTLDELKHFVRAAHDLGLYVILDWVANHTAWDSNLVAEHPDWYARDWKGDFRPTPWWNWVGVIDLDYENPELREYMTTAMKYWVSEVASTATAAMSPGSCRPTSGRPCGRNSTRSSRSFCWPNGNHETCTPMRST